LNRCPNQIAPSHLPYHLLLPQTWKIVSPGSGNHSLPRSIFRRLSSTKIREQIRERRADHIRHEAPCRVIEQALRTADVMRAHPWRPKSGTSNRQPALSTRKRSNDETANRANRMSTWIRKMHHQEQKIWTA